MRRVLASALLLFLVACGSDAGKSATTAADAVATNAPSATSGVSAPPTATGAATTPPANSVAATADGNPLDGAAFCAFLQQDLSALTSAGSAAGALAQFAGDFSLWIEQHPTQKPRTAADLDSASQPVCPDLRAQVVEALGTDSFVGALE